MAIELTNPMAGDKFKEELENAVDKRGDTMDEGATLILGKNPEYDMDAATKIYVDTNILQSQFVWAAYNYRNATFNMTLPDEWYNKYQVFLHIINPISYGNFYPLPVGKEVNIYSYLSNSYNYTNVYATIKNDATLTLRIYTEARDDGAKLNDFTVHLLLIPFDNFEVTQNEE